MPTETYESLRKESKLWKKYIFWVKLGMRWKVARKFTRKEIQDSIKLMDGQSLVRSYTICLNTFDQNNSECEWQFNELKAELLKRVAY